MKTIKPKLAFALALLMCLTSTLYAASGCWSTVVVLRTTDAKIIFDDGTVETLSNGTEYSIGNSNHLTIYGTCGGGAKGYFYLWTHDAFGFPKLLDVAEFDLPATCTQQSEYPYADCLNSQITAVPLGQICPCQQ